MLIRDLMLHLKSLLWCLAKDSKRYNLNLIMDSLNSRQVPESIQRTPLGRNLLFLIDELACCGGFPDVLSALKKIPKCECSIDTLMGPIEMGQYLVTIKKIEQLPVGSYGVISFISKDRLMGLFYSEGAGIVEKKFKMDQIKIIKGTLIDLSTIKCLGTEKQ